MNNTIYGEKKRENIIERAGNRSGNPFRFENHRCRCIDAFFFLIGFRCIYKYMYVSKYK